jgi:hypothetical protein
MDGIGSYPNFVKIIISKKMNMHSKILAAVLLISTTCNSTARTSSKDLACKGPERNRNLRNQFGQSLQFY